MSIRLDGSEDGLAEMHEINVTPFIDVILVLLIIFMVAAPLSTVDVSVDLPAASVSSPPRPPKPLFLTIKADLSLAVGENIIAREALASALGDAATGDKNVRIFLRADKTVPYGEMMKVMNALREAGFLKVALVALEEVKAP
jgi:biopolymer transport protein ExbD